ncbi:MAG: hypothetical protein WC525_07565 [Candidatus Thermoplasmatota archaeon]
MNKKLWIVEETLRINSGRYSCPLLPSVCTTRAQARKIRLNYISDIGYEPSDLWVVQYVRKGRSD